MTIKELYALCEQQIAKGKGDRHIYVSSDDEWNDWHELFYWFNSVNSTFVEEYRLEDMRNNHGGEKNCVLLW